MTWINTLFILVLFNALMGSLAFAVWKRVRNGLEKRSGYILIYRLLKGTVWFYLIPGCILAACNSNLRFFICHPGVGWGPYPGNMIKNVLFIFSLLWIAGMLGIGIRRSIHYYRFRKICKYNREMGIPDLKDYFKEICDRQDYYCTVWAYENEIIQVPMIFGIRKKYILFPKSTYTSQEIRIILEHELVHVKHHDLLMKRLVLFLCTLFWFVPYPSRLLEAMDDWCETACDISLCASAVSVWSRREYFEPIVNRACSQTVIGPGVALTLTGDMTGIKRRMLRIKRYVSASQTEQSGNRLRFWGVLLCFLLVGSILSSFGSWCYGGILLSGKNGTDKAADREIGCFSCRTVMSVGGKITSAGWVYLSPGKKTVFYLYPQISGKQNEEQEGILRFSVESRDGTIPVHGFWVNEGDVSVSCNVAEGGWYSVQMEYVSGQPAGITVIKR